MNGQNFHSTFSVDQSPDEVFAAITSVRQWWTGDIQGDTDEVGDEFTYRYGDLHYSKQRITELVPGKKVVWRVVDSHLAGTDDPSEWTGTDVIFEISEEDGRTQVRFAHVGLVPEFECFEACSNAWGFYVHGSLRRLILTGDGPATPPWA